MIFVSSDHLEKSQLNIIKYKLHLKFIELMERLKGDVVWYLSG